MAKASTTTVIDTVGQVVPYTFTVTNTGFADRARRDRHRRGHRSRHRRPAVRHRLPGHHAGPGRVDHLHRGLHREPGRSGLRTGVVADTATAHAIDPTERRRSAPSAPSIPTAPAPSLAVVKSASPTTVAAAGDPVDVLVPGHQHRQRHPSGVAVTDTLAAPAGPGPLTVTCPATTLPAAGSTTCTATVHRHPGRHRHRRDHNTATVAGTTRPTRRSPPTRRWPRSRSRRRPRLTVVKASTTTVIDTVGQVVPYTFTVTNNGSQTLHGVTVTDAITAPGTAGQLPAIACPDTTLAPAASTICTADYTVSQADLDSHRRGRRHRHRARHGPAGQRPSTRHRRRTRSRPPRRGADRAQDGRPDHRHRGR